MMVVVTLDKTAFDVLDVYDFIPNQREVIRIREHREQLLL